VTSPLRFLCGFSFPKAYLQPLRNCFLIGLVATISVIAAAQTAIELKKVQAKKADDFVDSVGINVHMEYTNTPYRNYQVAAGVDS
jgi:hypothetical protein